MPYRLSSTFSYILFVLSHYMVYLSLHISRIDASSTTSLLNATFDHVFLGFGDSLTKGYYKLNKYDFHISYHPYTITLSNLISHYWIEKGKNHVEDGMRLVELGVNGETTTVMLERFPLALLKYKPKVVAILGGTNDMFRLLHSGSRVGTYKDVYKNLEAMHMLAINSKAEDGDPVYSIAITIPPCGFPSTDRLKINEHLRILANRCNKRMGLVDLDSYPYFNMSEGGEKYWTGDFVHFSQLGYDTLAQLIFDVLVKKVVEAHLDVNVSSTNIC